MAVVASVHTASGWGLASWVDDLWQQHTPILLLVRGLAEGFRELISLLLVSLWLVGQLAHHLACLLLEPLLLP